MQPATTLMIASVGSLMTGSGTSSKRMSPGAWMVVARMPVILPRGHHPHLGADRLRDGDRPHAGSGVISYLRYRVRHG